MSPEQQHAASRQADVEAWAAARALIRALLVLGSIAAFYGLVRLGTALWVTP